MLYMRLAMIQSLHTVSGDAKYATMTSLVFYFCKSESLVNVQWHEEKRSRQVCCSNELQRYLYRRNVLSGVNHSTQDAAPAAVAVLPPRLLGLPRDVRFLEFWDLEMSPPPSMNLISSSILRESNALLLLCDW